MSVNKIHRVLTCHYFSFQVHSKKTDFSESCKVVVVNRLIEQNKDYRFNNKLQNACEIDIRKYCINIVCK